ncbi:MAG: putative membrane protein [Hyphomicrobiaceae bacterium]
MGQIPRRWGVSRAADEENHANLSPTNPAPTATFSTAVEVNENGDAVGWAIVDGALHAFLYTQEYGPILLPTDGVNAESQAVDLTDRDAFGEILIVGQATASNSGMPGSAHLWGFDTTTGTVTRDSVIGTLPGYERSVATAINADGLVVGYTIGVSIALPSLPMLFDTATQDLTELDFPALPADLSDAGVLVGGTFRGDLLGNAESLGVPVDQHTRAALHAVNDLGESTGTGTRSFSDGSGRFVSSILRYRHDWEILVSNSAFDAGLDINNQGDVVGQFGIQSSVSAVVYLETPGGLYFP